MSQQRLDFLVAKKLGVSRSVAANTIENGRVTVEGKVINKPSKKFAESSDIQIDEDSADSPPELHLKVLYEDDDCIVIDKPAGVLSHSKGVFSPENTVASWLLPKTRGFEKSNNRAGIVHRLDRGTSGVMICAKHPEALHFLQKQFSTRKVTKKYMALIEGNIDPPEAVIDIPIERNPKDPKHFRVSSNGKPARTAYRLIKSFTRSSKIYGLVELLPKTGRTHQLRVHLKHMNRPIVGDDFYDGLRADRLYLHAFELGLRLPAGQQKIFTSNLPANFLKPKIITDEQATY